MYTFSSTRTETEMHSDVLHTNTTCLSQFWKTFWCYMGTHQVLVPQDIHFQQYRDQEQPFLYVNQIAKQYIRVTPIIKTEHWSQNKTIIGKLLLKDYVQKENFCYCLDGHTESVMIIKNIVKYVLNENCEVQSLWNQWL